jgi:hypothetical protein
MLYKSIIVKDRTGKEIELRNAVVQDAEALIEYLKKIGVDGIESNYQYVNIKPSKELQDSIYNIRRVALENNFYETGGTDTHSKNIFFAGCDNYLDVLG